MKIDEVRQGIPEIDTAKCSFCGGRPDAYWCGVSTIYACYDCAVNTMPSLIVDAMRIPNMGKTRDALLHVEKRVWYALACRFARCKSSRWE